MPDYTKQVIAVRKDLKMSPGKAAAQVAHASVTAVLNQLEYQEDSGFWEMHWCSSTVDWWDSSQIKIVVSVNSEEDLIRLHNEAILKGLPTALIKDEGRTELGEPTFTTCAIGPGDIDEVDSITKGLPLYR